MKEATKRFWIVLGVASAAIHAVFCIQAFLPLQRGGMVSEGPWLLIFYPHYMLIFFLPPPYPITFSGSVVHVSYLHFWGKMFVAFPASVVYGILPAGVGTTLMHSRRHG